MPGVVDSVDVSVSVLPPAADEVNDAVTPAGRLEAVIVTTAPYRLTGKGSKDPRRFYVYGYSFTLDNRKTVRSITLPENEHVLVLALSLVP